MHVSNSYPACFDCDDSNEAYLLSLLFRFLLEEDKVVLQRVNRYLRLLRMDPGAFRLATKGVEIGRQAVTKESGRVHFTHGY